MAVIEAPTVMVGKSCIGLVSLSKSRKSVLLAVAREPKKPPCCRVDAGVTTRGVLVVVLGVDVYQFQVVDRNVVISGSAVVLFCS